MLGKKRGGSGNSFVGYRFNINKASQGAKVPFIVLLFSYGAIQTRLSVSSVSDSKIQARKSTITLRRYKRTRVLLHDPTIQSSRAPWRLQH
jgi:hypothetical protein